MQSLLPGCLGIASIAANGKPVACRWRARVLIVMVLAAIPAFGGCFQYKVGAVPDPQHPLADRAAFTASRPCMRCMSAPLPRPLRLMRLLLPGSVTCSVHVWAFLVLHLQWKGDVVMSEQREGHCQISRLTGSLNCTKRNVCEGTVGHCHGMQKHLRQAGLLQLS